MVLEDEGCAKANYNDVPWEQALEMAKGHSDHSARSFRDKLTYAAYLDIPSSWVFCEQDVLLPPAFQRETIDLIEQRSGKKVRVFGIDAGHCVTSTRPKELAALIQKILSN
jgi:pimeloyl-ACP methyl ester carboxylesterase